MFIEFPGLTERNVTINTARITHFAIAATADTTAIYLDAAKADQQLYVVVRQTYAVVKSRLVAAKVR
ncbi:MAG: hypothetical protein JWS10_2096 [Cypionkella sp.]|uniref:hypothetical protein n=1 Tax=Cypionkella sp. TaxID=2811411 RepID=UPI00260991D3|nr:hypothetical protein [Cypionkella sp.]MDB5659481.1 hypothetical protein [Cypionkella sp.]MDB5664963.1 hypothetical protein [Cypionkella sp.]